MKTRLIRGVLKVQRETQGLNCMRKKESENVLANTYPTVIVSYTFFIH